MIEKAGKPVGIAALYFYLGNVGITDFVIIKEFHRQGIGTALLQYVCQFAEERDANAVVLGASTQGAKFYPRFGFEHLGRFPTYLYSREMQRVDEQNSS
jgi:GNAT superfamily N-acetyltransferase